LSGRVSLFNEQQPAGPVAVERVYCSEQVRKLDQPRLRIDIKDEHEVLGFEITAERRCDTLDWPTTASAPAIRRPAAARALM
jgi:hypothetical protein